MHKEIGLRNLYFNRFLLIRYTAAFFLFLSLYWTVFLIGSLSALAIIPLCLVILGGLTAMEQVKIYRNHVNYLPSTQFFYRMVLLVCCLSLIAIYSPLYHTIFPFFKRTQDLVNILSGLFIANILICVLVLKKLNRIKHNKDRYFQKVQEYEKLLIK